MLGIVLVTVGFVLFHNAWFGLGGKVKEANSGKTLSIVNFLGGGTIFIIAIFTALAGDFFSAAIYFLVGLTYLYIGFDSLCDLDPAPFGVFCLTGAIGLFIGGVLTIQGGLETWREVWLLLCWFSWAILWFVLFVQYGLGKNLGKLIAVICLLTTFYTGWIPGIMMLAGWW